MTLHRFTRRAAAALLLAGASIHAVAATPAAGEDFDDFINAEWAAATAIPDGAGSWSVRAQLRDDNLKRMAALYARAARGEPGTSASARRVGLYYAAQMDRDAIERKGLAPLRPALARIDALRSLKDLSRYLGAQVRNDVDPVNFGATSSLNLFGLWVGPGLQDPSRNMAYLLQGGLSLPGPEHYAATDAQGAAVLDGYRTYIATQLTHAGFADGAARAARIVALETRIAAVHANAQASADLAQAGTLWRCDDFKSQAPGLDWDVWFGSAGLTPHQHVGAWQPGAIKGISALVAAAPLADWRDYLRFHEIDSHARFLPKAIADTYFAFYDPIYIGPGQHRSYLDHVINQTNTDMPAAGELFVQQSFSPAAKAKAAVIATNIVAAFRERIGSLAWMTPQAQAEARAKLDAMTISVGHPAQWRESTGLQVRLDDPFRNADRVLAFNYRHELAKIGRPVDRSEWILGAELFGINVMPLHNATTIPVTELQPPFFDVREGDASNYGAIGVRIARFIALSLGQDGSRFDATGQARSWLSKDELERRRAAASPLVAQYAGYMPFPELTLNGERTLNNNLADLMALQVAYDALQRARSAKGQAADQTGDRDFFSAYARSMRVKNTEHGLRGQVAGSPLAPAKYRIATVRNLAAWHAAFDIQPGQAWYLAPDKRVMAQ